MVVTKTVKNACLLLILPIFILTCFVVDVYATNTALLHMLGVTQRIQSFVRTLSLELIKGGIV